MFPIFTPDPSNLRLSLPADEETINMIGGLRDQMAMAALQGWLASFAGHSGAPDPKQCAELSYTIADAMLEARKVKGE